MMKTRFAQLQQIFAISFDRIGKTFAVTVILTAALQGFVGKNAHAQTQNALPIPTIEAAGKIYSEVTADEMAVILTDMNLTVSVEQASNGRKFLRAQTSGGANFFVDFLVCEDNIAATGCGGVLYRAGMSNSGVTYDDLNAFNRASVVASAFNLSELNLIGFTRLAIVSGGVQVTNLQVQLGLFLQDMDNYVKARAAATSVSFEGARNVDPLKTPVDQNASDKVLTLGALDQSRSSLDDLPAWAAGLRDSSMIESAIFNTYSVDFLNEEIRALLGQ